MNGPSPGWPGSVERVAQALRVAGLPTEIRLFEQPTRTAEQAARAVGCDVSQIVKSLVFMVGERPVLVLCSGANRVDTARLAALCGGPVRRATADEARRATGFAIGGIPPLGHDHPLETLIDEELLAHPVVWAAAGSPNAVFPVAPARLAEATRATVARLAEPPREPAGQRPGHPPRTAEHEPSHESRCRAEVEPDAADGGGV